LQERLVCAPLGVEGVVVALAIATEVMEVVVVVGLEWVLVLEVTLVCPVWGVGVGVACRPDAASTVPLAGWCGQGRGHPPPLTTPG
jgi:hypothetical protein